MFSTRQQKLCEDNVISQLIAASGLSRAEFARHLHISESRIDDWDAGRSHPASSIIEFLKIMASSPKAAPDFTFIDLFAGIGGLRRGFETIGGRCVFTCEWDRYSQKTYAANYPDDTHLIAGDIRGVDADDIPAHDVLLAGFPCQPFSIAGVSKKKRAKSSARFCLRGTRDAVFRARAHHSTSSTEGVFA
jgi:DNA (cytosine-5)-methyltransferase 1